MVIGVVRSLYAGIAWGSTGYCAEVRCGKWSCLYKGIGVSVVVVGVDRNVREICLKVSVICMEVSVGIA